MPLDTFLPELYAETPSLAGSNRVAVAGPWITEAEVAAVTDAVTSGWYGNATSHIVAFEEAFAQHTQRRFALSTPSCTAALHLLLAGLGIGKGDEVIVPELTWIATASPITYVGATPVFSDVDSVDWCLSADTLEACITPNTKAAIVVDLYGNMPNYHQLQAVADKHGIVLIEDAAQSIGAMYNDKPAGAYGQAAVFSFHGAKTLTTGEGGMLVLDDEDLYNRCVILRDHGRIPGEPRLFWQNDVGFKYKLSNIQAALGLAQLQRLPSLVSRKRALFNLYQQHLGHVEGLTWSNEGDKVCHSHWMSTVFLDAALGWEKIPLMETLRDRNIDVRPVFYPLSQLPAFSGYATQMQQAKARNTTAYHLSPYGINLPSALCLEDKQIIDASEALAGLLLK